MRKKYRFRCNNEHCHRIIKRQKTRPFRCTACGHGTMELQHPRNHCSECRAPIYGNVNTDCEVECSICTADRVASIEELEQEVGDELISLRDESRDKKNPDKPMTIIRNKKDYKLALELLKKKKEQDQQSQNNNVDRGKKVILTTISKKRRKS